MRRTRVLAVVVGFVGLVAVYGAAHRGPRLTDEERVKAAIERARQGVETHSLSRVMSVVSERYEDGNYNRDTLRGLIAFGLRQYPEARVVVYVREVRISGDEATAEAEVQATGGRDSGGKTEYRGVLRVRFAREAVRHHLVFPGHRWRAVRVDGLGDIQDALQ